MPRTLAECPHRGLIQGYIVCRHTLDGQPVRYHRESWYETIGLILCEACTPEYSSRGAHEFPKEDFTLWCAQCVREIFPDLGPGIRTSRIVQ